MQEFDGAVLLREVEQDVAAMMDIKGFIRYIEADPARNTMIRTAIHSMSYDDGIEFLRTVHHQWTDSR